jgi:hypothetical protein
MLANITIKIEPNKYLTLNTLKNKINNLVKCAFIEEKINKQNNILQISG